MSTIRKARSTLAPSKSRRKFTIEKALLLGFVGLSGLGMAQPALMTLAFSDSPVAQPIQIAAERTDKTPIGSIPKAAETPATALRQR